MVEGPEQWKWSSYGATAGIIQAPDFLTVDWILGVFGNKKGTAQERYRQFAKEGMNQKSPWENLRGQILLGEERFVEGFKELLTDKEKISEIPCQQRYAGRPPLSEMFDEEKMKTKAARNRGINQAHLCFGYTLKEIAEHLNLHYTTVSKAVKAMEDKI